ncbi:hypothetical protein [uncultured Methanobacterium sp.]|uniref:hypothetical protein n=1 Tax=uncultured Methanobacterium sp. TaxID=176306 RepID=UPI002AA64937|nr:hypothetical protein [uncultured Methanobacterium sp.]
MVIAKPEWFKRKNRGFLGYQITWQGAVYLTVAIIVLLFGILFTENLIINLIATGLFLFLFMDALSASLKSLDEREQMHSAIAMRNAAWGMIITMIIMSIIFSSFRGIKANLSILFIITALIGGIINVMTLYKLERGS